MLNKSNQLIALLIWLISIGLLIKISNPFYGFLFFLPFSLFPHAINHTLIFKFTSKHAQWPLLIGQLLYFFWFIYVYVDAFYINLDAQSSFGLLFVGIASIPIMVLIWLLSKILNRKKDGKKDGKKEMLTKVS